MENDPVLVDVAGLKAVSHPLRVRMLAALRSDGPATASELARRFATDTGSTSYHLRTLAKHGFVAPAPDQRDRRERRWQATRPSTDWDAGALSRTAEGRAAVGLMLRQQVAALTRAIESHEAAQEAAHQAAHEPAHEAAPVGNWQRAAGLSDLVVRITPASLDAIVAALEAHAAERAEHDRDDPDARPVHLFAGGFPT